MSKRKYFGTDGIRGHANKHPMTADFALKTGMAAAVYFNHNNKNVTNRVVIGKDTRLSCYMLETALTAGLSSMGKNVILLGPLPTPAVAMLTQSIRADFGIMISASHNPYADNGIKIFDNNGYKLVEEDEKKIEAFIDANLDSYVPKAQDIGRVSRLEEAAGRYIEYVKQTFPKEYTLHGLKIVVDCANGASYKIAPIVFYELGADVIPIGVSPDGININHNCGSTHITNLQKKVLEENADIGISFDGDADRVIIVDEQGNIIDGDKIMAIIATQLKTRGALSSNTVVGTVMANKALEVYLRSQEIKFIRTKVGDKYVADELRSKRLVLGGEQSGHIILPKFGTTGDGIIATLQVLAAVLYDGINNNRNPKASISCNLYDNYPQVLKNISFSGVNPIDTPEFTSYITKIQKQEQDSRILVRKSGTENLIRVMVEGVSEEKINLIADNVIDFIKTSCN